MNLKISMVILREWSALHSSRREAALSIAREIARRLDTQEKVQDAIAASTQQTLSTYAIPWRGHAVARGYAGLALFYGHLDACFPTEGWDRIAHQFLDCAVQDISSGGSPSLGLFSGLSGVAFVSWYLSHQGTRYRKLRASLEAQLLSQTIAASEELADKNGVMVSEFDVVSGLAGVGAYLLWRRDEVQAEVALRTLLASLIELTLDHELPHWHTPPSLLLGTGMIAQYPYGNLNCGLAHGIPGPLALFALALMHGVSVNGLTEAVRRIADWLIQQQLNDPWGINWPSAVPLISSENGFAVASLRDSSSRLPTHTAWCYGAPGIARALWLAGCVLDDPDYCAVAIEAMAAVYRKPIAQRHIDSPTFCHGVAGLLQITLRFANETGLPMFVEAGDQLLSQLIGLYSPSSRLGYYNLEASGQPSDQPGLLEGAPGVALVLLAAALNHEPRWDRLFLLS